MNPNQTQQNTQLDPSIVALTKAIGISESGGKYDAVGKSGEYGAYQYTQPTWQADSQKYLGQDIPLESATPAQQDEVAYKKIQDLGSQGYKPDQIASIWNSGKPDYAGNIGTNKYGVHFDTPAYVKSVGANYEKIMSGGQATQDSNNPSSTTNQNTQTQSTQQPTQQHSWLQQLAVGVGSSFIGTAKFIGDLLGLKPTPFGEKILASAQNLDNGTAKNIGQGIGYAGQLAPVIAETSGLVGGLVGKGAADTFPTLQEYLDNPQAYEEVIKTAPVAKKVSLVKKLIEGGLLFEGGKTVLNSATDIAKQLFGKYIAPQVIPNQETINPAP